jgi:hypothetical protein
MLKQFIQIGGKFITDGNPDKKERDEYHQS